MLWFAVPIAILAGKLIYDAATDDSSSSSSSSSSSDNSAEVARRERKRQQQQARKQQQQRKQAQLKQQLHAELHDLSIEYLAQPVTLSASANAAASQFCAQTVSDEQSAQAALSLIADGRVSLKPAVESDKKSATQTAVRELAELEHMLKEV